MDRYGVNRGRYLWRRLFWMAHVVGAGIAGVTIRLAQRLVRRPPRIVHGTYPMHMTAGMVQADRRAGFPSRSIATHVRLASYALVERGHFDAVFETDGVEWDEWQWAALAYLLRHADIWVSYFDSLPLGRGRLLLRAVRAAGIRLIAAPNGLDVVYATGVKTRYDWVGRLARDYPEWDIPAETPRRRVRVEMMCDAADLVIAGDAASARFLPRNDLAFKYFPIDVDAFEPNFEPNRVPRIVHAPNHRALKGTDVLLGVLDDLRAELPFELTLIEKTPRAEALRLYREADIIADQFCIGAFGVLALEGLALGKTVLAYLDEESLGDPRFNLPIVNTTHENMRAVLRILLRLPELRRRLGTAGRAAVEHYQSVPALAEVWSRIYRHVWNGAPLHLEQTAHFAPERLARAFSEDPATAEFWPVDVSDLMTEIAG
jgi:glycosyltransferase involved in cell wall biosynthesis